MGGTKNPYLGKSQDKINTNYALTKYLLVASSYSVFFLYTPKLNTAIQIG